MNFITSMSGQQKRACEAFLLVVVYGISFFAIQFLLYQFHLLPYLPDAQNIGAWDGSWYRSIAQNGYVHTASAPSNTGFYVLFPWIWKLSHLGVWGISFLNLLLFAAGFSLIVSIYPVSIFTQLLWLSTPAIYFMFVPYSEATFFLLGALCLFGISTRKNYLVFIALFLISLTRSVSVLLIPSFFIMQMLSFDREKWKHALLDYIVLYALPLVLGIFAFYGIQYYSTGVWNAYIQQQSTVWGHIAGGPRLPFSNLNLGVYILWFHAVCLFACVIAGIFIIKSLLEKWKGRIIMPDKGIILSIAYLTFTLILTFYFSPLASKHSTHITGVERYIAASPFILVFFYYFAEKHHYQWTHYAGILVLYNLFCLLFGSYQSLENFLVFNVGSLMIVLYMLQASGRRWAALVLMFFNIAVQITYFQIFISGKVLPE